MGRGWGDEKFSFSIGDGIIYSITRDGKLKWFRHNAYLTGAGLDTPGSWEGPKEVGTGWSGLVQVFGIGSGFIYGVTPAGKLMWYHHKGYRDGRVAWDGPVEVGHGWENLLLVFAQP